MKYGVREVYRGPRFHLEKLRPRRLVGRFAGVSSLVYNSRETFIDAGWQVHESKLSGGVRDS